MTRRRRLAVAIAILLLLALGIAVLLPRLVDADRYRSVLERRATRMVGREVRLGEMRLRLLPTTGLRVDRLAIAGAPETGGDLLVAEGLTVGVRLLPLLRGRLEITSARMVRPVVHLHRDAEGGWNLVRLLAERRARAVTTRAEEVREPGTAGGGSGTRGNDRAIAVSIERFRLRDGRLIVTDAGAEPGFELILAPFDLGIDGLAAGRSAGLGLDARFEGDPEASLQLEGEAGPLAAGEPLPFAGELLLRGVGPDLLARIGRLAGADLSALARRIEALSATVDVDAELPDRAHLRGRLDLGRVALGAAPGAGATSERPQIASRFELRLDQGTRHAVLDRIELDVGETTLALAGRIAAEGDGVRRIELALEPARLPADRLAALLATVRPDPPFTFSSPQPIQIEGRIEGPLGPERRPRVVAEVKVADLRLEHEALLLPIERISATMELTNDTLVATGLVAGVGESDLAGELRIEGFAVSRGSAASPGSPAPGSVAVPGRGGALRARFDVSSRRADLDQLFGMLRAGSGTSGGPGGGERGDAVNGAPSGEPAARGGAAPGGLFDRLDAEGRIRVERATWGELEASDVAATARIEGGSVRLDPVIAGVYGGRFDGRIDALPGRSPLPFQLEGRAHEIRVDQFLTRALGVEERLAGSFSGTLRASGAAGEWPQLARSLEGRGEMRIENGRVRSFPLLGTVAEVAGVFGERTIASLAGRLADSATRFALLRGAFRVDEGAVGFEEVTLESEDFELRGSGAIDLSSAALSGQGALVFSAELSELMRRDGSRAGELFWSAETGRVALPLELRGALSDPSALVDWESAVRGYAERRIEREVERQIDRLLERLGRPRSEPAPAPP